VGRRTGSSVSKLWKKSCEVLSPRDFFNGLLLSRDMRSSLLLLCGVVTALLFPLSAQAQEALLVDAEQEECTVGVASGLATADGRPLMWKNRDAKHRDNTLRQFDDGRWPYVGLVNAGAREQVWGGVNAAGFCIMNSLSRDFAQTSKKGKGNGRFMKLALQQCAHIEDFAALLDKTNKSGRRTRANFGVIDALGGAAIFETGHETYTRFDANEENGGVVVRTNFATTAGGKGGKLRFGQICKLALERPKDQPLSLRYLFRNVIRDLTPPPSAVAGSEGQQDVRETLHRQTTVASMVFHGVRPEEDPRLTTMWAALGQPLFTSMLPSWPSIGTSKLYSGSPRSPLCDAAIGLQSGFYELPRTIPDPTRPDDAAITLSWLLTARLPMLQGELLPFEDSVLQRTRALLAPMRGRALRITDRERLAAFHEARGHETLRLLRSLRRRHAQDAPLRLLGFLKGLPAKEQGWLLEIGEDKWSSKGSKLDVMVPRATSYVLRITAASRKVLVLRCSAARARDGILDLGRLELQELEPTTEGKQEGGGRPQTDR
jgi:hypothetical protein